MWRRIWTLIKARNREYFRDKSALGWNFAFPFLIILGFGLIFTEERQTLYKVGVLVPGMAALQTDSSNTADGIYTNFKDKKFIEFIEFSSRDNALDKLKHHRIDFLVAPKSGEYWVSKTSPKGYIVERLFHSSSEMKAQGYHKQEITGREIPYVEWLFPGILGLNIMFSALFGVGYVIVRYRKNGVLKRISVTPVSAFEFLTAQVVSRIFILFFTAIVVFVGCVILFGFECRGSYFDLVIVLFMGSFSLITLGLIVASRSESEEFTGGILNLMTWPMMFLCEVWFSMEGAQPWLQKATHIFPLTHLIDASRRIMNDGAGLYDVRYQVTILAAMSLLFLLAGSVLFKWHKD